MCVLLYFMRRPERPPPVRNSARLLFAEERTINIYRAQCGNRPVLTYPIYRRVGTVHMSREVSILYDLPVFDVKITRFSLQYIRVNDLAIVHA